MCALPFAPCHCRRCSIYSGVAHGPAPEPVPPRNFPSRGRPGRLDERYFERPEDYYFIIEDADSGEPHGAIGIYDIEENAAGALWGRWILKHGSMAALESVWLICETALSKLGLASVSSRTLVENPRVVSFHDSFGATRFAQLEGHFLVRGERKSAIEHQIKSTDWPALRARHYTTICRLARRTALSR